MFFQIPDSTIAQPDRLLIRGLLRLLYTFLGEPEFAHDYENLDDQEPGFAARIGVQGLHEVKRKVALRPRQTVLPPGLFKHCSPLDFWKNHEGSLAHVINATASLSPSPSA